MESRCQTMRIMRIVRTTINATIAMTDLTTLRLRLRLRLRVRRSRRRIASLHRRRLFVPLGVPPTQTEGNGGLCPRRRQERRQSHSQPRGRHHVQRRGRRHRQQHGRHHGQRRGRHHGLHGRRRSHPKSQRHEQGHGRRHSQPKSQRHEQGHGHRHSHRNSRHHRQGRDRRHSQGLMRRQNHCQGRRLNHDQLLDLVLRKPLHHLPQHPGPGSAPPPHPLTPHGLPSFTANGGRPRRGNS